MPSDTAISRVYRITCKKYTKLRSQFSVHEVRGSTADFHPVRYAPEKIVILPVHVQSALCAPNEEEIKQGRRDARRNAAEFFEISKNTLDLSYWKGDPDDEVGQRRRPTGGPSVDISFLLTSTVTLAHVIPFPAMNT